MSQSSKIVFLTDISASENKDNPASLAFEISQGTNAECIYLSPIRKLEKLGLGVLSRVDDYRLQRARYIICYPSYMYFKVPRKFRKKLIVVGPDSATLLFRRLYRNCKGFLAVKYLILSVYFFYLERRVIEKTKSYLVVGRSDRYFINKFVKPRGNFAAYLTHPCFSKLRPNPKSFAVDISRSTRIIFAGDLSQKYVGRCGLLLAAAIVENFSDRFEVIIVGKRNEWLYKKVAGINVRYEDWLDDYTEVLLPNDVHVVPLFAGAGTKNRVLTALSYNCRVISTSIGLENTNHENSKVLKIKKWHLDDIQGFISDVENFIMKHDLSDGPNFGYFNKRMAEFRSDLYRQRIIDKAGDY